MIVSLIAALDEAGGIGRDGTLPWHLRSDLKRFKRITMGHTLVMGRKTYDSIGKALPGRTNIVITRNPLFEAPGCLLARSLKSALEMAQESAEEEVFIIGGGQIFLQALGFADRIYLTRVHTVTESQVFFPPISWADWDIVEQETLPASEYDEFATTYSSAATIKSSCRLTRAIFPAVQSRDVPLTNLYFGI